MVCPSVEAGAGLQETMVDPPEQESVPQISLSWTLDPTTHSYSSDLPPTLSVVLTSHAKRPITFYNDCVKPGRLLYKAAFSIFDCTSGVEVKQRKRIYCVFEPPSKVKVQLPEHMFWTLYPEVPLVFTAAFGPTKEAPKAFSDVYTEANVELPPEQARGVDRLIPGHHYRLRAGRSWGRIRWWEYGEKEEVMNPPNGRLDGRELIYRTNKSPHPRIDLHPENLPDIDFWCVE